MHQYDLLPDPVAVVGVHFEFEHRLFRLQAASLTLSGLPAGILCGVVLVLMLNHAVRGLWGYGMPFRIQWNFLLGVIGATLLTGIAAGYGNGRLQRWQTAEPRRQPFFRSAGRGVTDCEALM
jgi:hypothetical protein